MPKAVDRRNFLKTLGGLALVTATPVALAKPVSRGERIVAVHNLHTGEALEAHYWRDGAYDAAVLAQVNHVLRDHRSGEVHEMDPRLLDQLYLLQRSVGVERPFEIISGYRSPATNARLRQASSGVAKRSLHMQGRAMDIRLPGCGLKRLREEALALKAGGVGYYPRSGFVHIDTGRVRFW